MQLTEDQLVALLAEHYEPVTPPAGFEQSLLAEVESEFRRLHSRVPRLSRWNIFRRTPMSRLAIPVGLATAAVLLAILALLPPRNLLAQTAEKMKGIRTLHYELAVADAPDQEVQEFWTRLNETYSRTSVNGRTVAEAWINGRRMVAYNKEKNEVVIQATKIEFLEMSSLLQFLCELRPSDWKSAPKETANDGSREWSIYETPATGMFYFLGRCAVTQVRLWVDPKTALPGKVEGLGPTASSDKLVSLLTYTFLWPEPEAPESIFEPKYPADAKVTTEPQAMPPPAVTPILNVSKDGKTGIALEKAWINPAGLVILRLAWQGRQPFGEPPHLKDPSKNPWGLKREEIRQALNGLLSFEPPVRTEYVAIGGVPDRWVGYMIFRFSPLPDGQPPDKLHFRYLLARSVGPEDGDRRMDYIEAVLNDPSAWELYEFSIPTQPYLTEQIPEEIYDSLNLPVTEKPFMTALRGILAEYEAQSPEKALQFLKLQGPHTQQLLNKIMQEHRPSSIVPTDSGTAVAASDVLSKTAERMKGVRTLHFEITAPSLDARVMLEMWSRGDKIYCVAREKDRVVSEEWANSQGFVGYLKDENRVIIAPTEPGLQVRSVVQWVNDFKPSEWKLIGQETSSDGGLKWLVLEMPGTGKISGLKTSGDTRSRLWVEDKTDLPGKLEVQQSFSSGVDWTTNAVFRFLWDDSKAPDSFFEPKYPADAKVTEESQAVPPPAVPPILNVSKDGKTGIALEKAWVNPAGLVILRVALQGRQPFGEPPHLADPSKNPWGLKPEEIPQVIGEGQLLLEPPAHTEIVAEGGMANRWAGYAVFRFNASPDGKAPVKLKFRQLLGRTRRPGDGDFKEYVNAVLKDPSSWELYEFSIPVQPYLTDQIPEEIYASPNLMQISNASFTQALRSIVRDYETQSPQKALRFLKAQGPHTQELLRDEMLRLTAK
jgi:outer membrane lipoprotein-sorting protein